VDILRAFRVVSLAEATSFLVLLLVAMPLKYGADLPAAVQIMGPIHGVLFLAYVGLVFVTRGRLGWNLGRTFLALVASVLPVAPYFVEHNWIKEPVPSAQNSRGPSAQLR
jgi:integral membrane protein